MSIELQNFPPPHRVTLPIAAKPPRPAHPAAAIMPFVAWPHNSQMAWTHRAIPCSLGVDMPF